MGTVTSCGLIVTVRLRGKKANQLPLYYYSKYEFIPHISYISPAVPCVLLVALCEEEEEGGVCVEWRAALRVRPAAAVSAFPFTSCGGCFGGALCLREEGREGAGGDGSLFPVTLDDTRLFLSGLEAAQEEQGKSHLMHSERHQKPEMK